MLNTWLIVAGLIVILSLAFSFKLKVKLTASLSLCLVSGLVCGIAGNLIFNFTGSPQIWLKIGLLGTLFIMILLLIVLSRFFRDPDRLTPNSDKLIFSPADGTIIYIKHLENGEIPLSVKHHRPAKLIELLQTDILTQAAYLIGIEMNILNVHVNRAPVRGEVIFNKHIPGSFLSLRDENSAVRNERMTTIFDQGKFKIGVVQIASRLVRRIESYLQTGDKVVAGQRMGMIKFGSQVDVIIPELIDMKLKVKIGEEVVAGVTVLFEHDN